MKKIFISAGEASGDVHAANLANNLKRIYPHPIQIYGMGGPLMQQNGINILVSIDKLAIIGITGVLIHLPQIIRTFYKIKNFLRDIKPDWVILVDYPEFNLHLAKTAKKMGLKVLYYISPQLWAWRQGRIKTIQRYVDHMAVIFPFEVDFYKKFNVNVTLIRHPLLDKVTTKFTPKAARDFFQLTDTTTIGLLPGSRHDEIKRLLPIMAQTMQILQLYQHNIQFILPLASTITPEMIKQYLPTQPNLKIVTNTYDAIAACDAVIACSGTVTLEVALLHVPMVIIYRVSLINYWIAKLLLHVPYIGLCNVIAQEKIVPELLQNHATASNIAHAIIKILEDKEYRENMITKLAAIHMRLKQSDNDIAHVVAELQTDSKY